MSERSVASHLCSRQSKINKGAMLSVRYFMLRNVFSHANLRQSMLRYTLSYATLL